MAQRPINKSNNRRPRRATASDSEIKFLDVYSNLSTISWEGNNIDITSLIPQGVSQNERVGNVIRLEHIKYKFTVKNNASTGAGVRVIVFYDHQNTYVSLADLLDDQTSGLNYTTFRDRNQLYRFTIISDKTYSVDGIWKNKLYVEQSNKINKLTRYLFSGTTVSSGSLRVLFVSDRALTATAKMGCTGSIRLLYTDQ